MLLQSSLKFPLKYTAEFNCISFTPEKSFQLLIFHCAAVGFSASASGPVPFARKSIYPTLHPLHLSLLCLPFSFVLFFSSGWLGGIQARLVNARQNTPSPPWQETGERKKTKKKKKTKRKKDKEKEHCAAALRPRKHKVDTLAQVSLQEKRRSASRVTFLLRKKHVFSDPV